MPKTLYAKLALALLVLLTVVSLFYVGLTVATTRMHIQEVEQSLNRTLAASIVESKPLIRDGTVDQKAIKDIFHMLMVVNPDIEVYLVDADGKILTYSAPAGKVQRERISLNPVRAFLGGHIELPILGDDPRDHGGRKIFSAAAVQDGKALQGYLYVVLGGEAHDSVAAMFEGSYVLRLSVGIAAACLLLALAAGLLSFNWLTRRLRRLTAIMTAFKDGDFQRPVTLPESWHRLPGDEIDRLGVTFEQMAKRINDQIRQLNHIDASRRELVANISHDLRTPLTSLQGSLETLAIKQDALSEEEKRRYLDLALKHSERLQRLIGELFELAMLESRDRQLHFEPFSLAELVQDVSQKFTPRAAEKHIRIDTDVPAHAPFVSADIGLIERVLENLIENAVKYTPDGGRIHLALVADEGQMTARVSDTGQGIPEDDLPRIFERTYRVEKDRGDAVEGAGLGLAIAQRILQLHGSPIEVESEVGAGTTFSFHLPVAHA